MSAVCPKCGTPYGQRKRCYKCAGKPRTGREAECKQCGKQFYVQANQLQRGEGVFCSQECKTTAQKGCDVAWARRDEKTLHSAGYVLVWNPDHPRSSRGRVFEHILVAEKTVGRALLPGEFVHHRDGNKQNNAPENLQIVSNREHGLIHVSDNPHLRRTRVQIECAECGKSFSVRLNKVRATDPKSRAKYCSLDCRHKAWGKQMVQIRRNKRLKE